MRTLAHMRLQTRSWVRGRPLLYKLVRFVKYGPYRGLGACPQHEEFLAAMRQSNALVLYLGCGGRRQPGMINLDITPVNEPDVVGDGYMLPFADETFDAIMCESVIEHVDDPERFLHAASQALKPGGLWFLEVPFLQPFHGGTDFQRWTMDGFSAALRRAGLEPVASGTRIGPGFMLMWILKEWFALVLSGGNRRLRAILGWFLGFLFSPLALLDPLLLRLPGAEQMACSHFHIARRPLSTP